LASVSLFHTPGRQAIGEGVAGESALSDIVRVGRDGTEAAAPIPVQRDQS